MKTQKILSASIFISLAACGPATAQYEVPDTAIHPEYSNDTGSQLDDAGIFDCADVEQFTDLGQQDLSATDCDSGYQLIDNACVDINECDENPCDDICENTPGSYICSSDQSSDASFPDHASVPDTTATPDTATAPDTRPISCPNGYELNAGICVDINECLSTPCNNNETCTNSDGSFNCTIVDCTTWDFTNDTTCPAGFYNCDCANNCGATTPCAQDAGSSDSGSAASCTSWDFTNNAPCPEGWYNCDCANNCGGTTPCSQDAGSASTWPPTDAVEIASFHGRANGDRPTFYFSLLMAAYPNTFTVVVVDCASITVPNNNGTRYESGGYIIKQSDVAGRGMAVVGPSSCHSERCYLKY